MNKQCNHKEHQGERSLPIESFHKDAHSSDGVKSMCKTCASKKAQVWRKCRAVDPTWRAKFNDQNTKYRHAAGKVGQMLQAARSRAFKKGIEFLLTKEDIVIPATCPILGIPIIAGNGRKSDSSTNKLVGATDNSPSLDRIDNTKGYVRHNVRVVSWRANYLKNTATLEELIKLGDDARSIIEKQKIPSIQEEILVS